MRRIATALYCLLASAACGNETVSQDGAADDGSSESVVAADGGCVIEVCDGSSYVEVTCPLNATCPVGDGCNVCNCHITGDAYVAGCTARNCTCSHPGGDL